MPEKVYTRFIDELEGPPNKRIKKKHSSEDHEPSDGELKPMRHHTDSVAQSSTDGNIPRTKQGKSLVLSDKSHRNGGFKVEAERLLHERRKLPIWKHQDSLKVAIENHNVVIVVGETGSGKSTQVPQFLLSEPWSKEQKVIIDGHSVKIGGRVVITQPRRVAAINLARRVAKEMGTPLGNASPMSKVGYSVRFDNCTSPSTTIKYVTEGTLLQQMLADPWLRQNSAILIDEVHERGINVDLLLGFMKRMVQSGFQGRGGIPLKIIIMSATAEVEVLQNFFSEVSPIALNGSDTVASNIKVGLCSIEGRQFPVQTLYSPEPINDILEACLKTIVDVNKKEPLPGDILVFLYGQEAIESVEKMVNDEARNLDRGVPKLLALPLFAALPQDIQQRVFQRAPPGTRKIILSTNIAETSVTVSGVRFVIDCGKFKMKQFRTSLGLDSLLVKPISKSSAIQRQGRAGREAPGKCWRLYTEKAYHEILPEATPPEILRCDLAHAILNMKARGVDDVMEFPFLDKPRREAFEEALLQLLFVGALNQEGQISTIGQRIAKLPLSIPLGRVLIAAIDNEEDILSEIVDIVSCLSVENIFLNLITEEAREKAEEARRSLYRREGDHLTLLKTIQGYAAEKADRKTWSQKHFVNHRAMRAVMVSPPPTSAFSPLLKVI